MVRREETALTLSFWPLLNRSVHAQVTEYARKYAAENATEGKPQQCQGHCNPAGCSRQGGCNISSTKVRIRVLLSCW